MNFDTLLSDIIATIIGGAILALMFFWVREKFFALPSVAGRWHFETRTTNTSYRPYEGMVLRYLAILWQEGNRIQGTIEKIYEKSSTGEREYVGKNRTRGKIDGFLEKNYFTKDRMYLHVVEEGHGRESTSSFELIFKADQTMIGTFTSMVANSEGNAIWQRAPF